MVIITAPGKEVDFVSRFFAPAAGVDEDSVTGSVHSQLIPFWSYKLGKTKMTAKQLSKQVVLFIANKKETGLLWAASVYFT
jgi:predicted PhzF superfamily epimerase YddE/YHI9